MKVISLHPDDIEFGERHRALSADAVDRLTASLAEIGLKQPITIRLVDEMEIDGKVVCGVPVLIAGAHRLAAAKKLGWTAIDCIEADDDPISAELWEIAENLHRLDLSREQRDEHIRRYAELLEEKARVIPQQNAAVLPKRGPGQPKAIPRQVAEQVGLSVDTVRRALNPRPRPGLVEVVDPYDAVIAQADAIVRAWNRACPEARQLALSQIDAPVFDKTNHATIIAN